MGWTVRVVGGGWFCALMLGSVPATASDLQIVEQIEHGRVNWTERVVSSTGSGTPDAKRSNVAQRRLAAERAAQADAARKILETLKGVRVRASTLGAGPLARAEVGVQVQNIIRACKTVDTRYYSDGGVDVVVRCSLDGGLSSALVPIDGRRTLPTTGKAEYSGLIVDAVGTRVRPALAPRLVDPDGKVVYSVAVVGPNLLRERGAARFASTVEAARRDPRVGSEPLVVKAAGLGETATDVELSAEDAAKLSQGNLSFLVEGRVVIATDGP